MAAAATSPPPTAAGDHARLLLRGFLSAETCKELEFVHRSSGTAGYRPSVVSTSLPHLAATGCGHLLLPFVPIRERLRDAVESFFSCHFDLFVEFTGLISWCKGASIGWHSDDNKPYLRQRAFTAVCYLNNHGKDYKGGTLRFHDGEPSSIEPVAGDVVIYTADNRNVHCVDEVTEGERLTLTLWFTRDSAYDEDPKLLNFLSQTSSGYEPADPNSYLPLPASDNMYRFSYGQSGFDIRCARVHILGFSFHAGSDEESSTSVARAEDDPIELLGKPLRLGRGDDVFEKIFANSLHALQLRVKNSDQSSLAIHITKSTQNRSNSNSFLLSIALVFSSLYIGIHRKTLCLNMHLFLHSQLNNGEILVFPLTNMYSFEALKSLVSQMQDQQSELLFN